MPSGFRPAGSSSKNFPALGVVIYCSFLRLISRAQFHAEFTPLERRPGESPQLAVNNPKLVESIPGEPASVPNQALWAKPPNCGFAHRH